MPQGQLYKQYAYFYQRAGALYARPEIRASLEIILSVFTVTLLIFFAIRPTITNVVSLQKKIEDQQTVLTKANKKVAQLLAAETQLDQNRDRLQLFDAAVPNDVSYFNIGKRIEIIAQESGVTFTTERMPGTIILGGRSIPRLTGDMAKNIVGANENGITMLNVSFTINGDQSQVLDFMNKLENMDMLAVVQTVKIVKTTTSGLQPELSLVGNAWFYAYKTTETASK